MQTERERGGGGSGVLTMPVSESPVVIGHSDEVVSAWGLLAGQAFPQEEVREVQVPAATEEGSGCEDRSLIGV